MLRNCGETKLSNAKLNYIRSNLIGNNVLDAGAGYCYYSEWLVNNKPNLNVVCIDKLELPSQGGIQFLSVNLEEPLPLENNTFDTIFAFDVFEYIDNEHRLLKELYRVCKNNGVIIGSVPHDNAHFLPAYNLTYYQHSDTKHKRRYSISAIRETLTNAGFQGILIEQQGLISPKIIAEFFPRSLQFFVRKTVQVLHGIRLIRVGILASELFFVAYKK